MGFQGGYLRRTSKGTLKGDFRGDFKQDFEGDLVSSSGQVDVSSGRGLIQFTAQINNLELDSEVGRLVWTCI